MQDLHINIHFWCCATKEIDDFVAFAQVLQRHQVILLKPYTLEPLSSDEWRSTFQNELDEKKAPHPARINHAIAFSDWGKQIAGFSLGEYKEGGNLLQFGGVLDFEFKDQRPLVEPFAQRLLAIARELYPLARPIYGDVDGGWHNWDTEDVFKRRLNNIAWVNFFSPGYVEKYGKDFLLGIPGYKTEALPDGGVFHQLSPTFVAPSHTEAKTLRQHVIAYCAQHGLKATCHAPFAIPGLTPTQTARAAETISDAELRVYLQQILATTLVLDDGTRVKPIVIPWAELTARQQQIALQAIQQAALAEIKRRGRGRIRLEFNDIPEELEQMLQSLVGQDNPDVEWTLMEETKAP